MDSSILLQQWEIEEQLDKFWEETKLTPISSTMFVGMNDAEVICFAIKFLIANLNDAIEYLEEDDEDDLYPIECEDNFA